jgi:endonuclease-3
MEALTRLPGVARKTANVVLGTAFGIAAGVVVDTHVARITRRWAFHDLKDAKKIEQVLMALLPRERWIAFSHETIWHGRRLCDARKPRCSECPFLPHCPSGV